MNEPGEPPNPSYLFRASGINIMYEIALMKVFNLLFETLFFCFHTRILGGFKLTAAHGLVIHWNRPVINCFDLFVSSVELPVSSVLPRRGRSCRNIDGLSAVVRERRKPTKLCII